MKRRWFLRMMGATAAAPLMPALPAGAASVLTPRVKAMGLAHAHRYPMVSVLGMTKRLGISHNEATELLAHLTREGLVGAPGLKGTGITSAASRVFRPVPHQIAAVRNSMKRVKFSAEPKMSEKAKTSDPAHWLAHLRVIAAQNGFVLQPRALAQVAA